MKCEFCRKRDASIKFLFNPVHFCDQCFQTFLEKKVLKNVRKNKLLKQSHIKISEEDKVEKKVLIHILLKYFSKSNKIELVPKEKENVNAKSVEECATEFLESLLKGSETVYPPENNLLDGVSIYELIKYAELEKITFNKPNFGKIYTMLKKISLNNPSIFFSIFQSGKKIKEKLEKEANNR
ncbi:MAG: hypothetical protein PWP03_315 [Candidatus Woesearchaeota archaeon]|nr:hypothetical protein [Candidatus Woesearchaeota archaeon]